MKRMGQRGRARRRRNSFSAANVGNPREHDEQAALIKRIQVQTPELWDRITAVTNGTYDGNWYRASAASRKARAEGQHAGYPDWLLDYPRGPFHGFRCEMKRVKSYPSDVTDDQRRWGHQLNSDGYLCVVGKGAEDAWQQLQAYVALGEFDQRALPSTAPFRILNEANYPL